MVEIKHSGKSMEQRIADRLKPSTSPEADIHTQQGSGPTRVHHAVHLKGNVMSRGPDHKGEGNIFGQPRGPANRKGEI
jgi:hypothetical protein